MHYKQYVTTFTLMLLFVFQATNLHAQQSQSDSSEVSTEILSLLKSQDLSDAYQLALQSQFNNEGDPRFDYAFGAAARANNQLNQAVFAFERVLQVQPNAIDARIALAMSYYDLGNLDAAEKELTTLQSFNLNNATLNNTIQTYLTAIQQKRAQLDNLLHASARLGFGHDSNPNNGVEDEFITIPSLGPVTLFDESLENDSAYADFQGQLNYVKPINQHSSWQVAGSILHAEYSDDLALNRTFVTTSLGYSTRLNDVDFSGSVFYRPLWLDGDSLLDYYGVIVTASKQVSGPFIAGIDLSISTEDYTELRGFDRDQLLANAWLEVSQSNGAHRFAIRFGQEQAADNNDFLDRDLLGLGYEWRRRLDQQWEYSVSIDYLDSEYQEVHPLFGVTRKDRFLSSDVELRYAVAESWALMSKLSYLQNDSDIDLYEYQRVKIWLGASYEF